MKTSSGPEPLKLLLRSEGETTLHRKVKNGTVLGLAAGQGVDLQLWRLASRLQRYLILVSSLHHSSNAVFCCETALELYGIPTFGVPGRISTVARGGHCGRRGRMVRPGPTTHPADLRVPLHVAHRHEAATLTLRSGLRITSPAHACAQVLAHARLEHAIPVADHLTHRSAADQRAVLSEIGRLAYPAWREKALTRFRAGRAKAMSPLESASRGIVLGAGFPEPQLQHEFRDREGFIGIVDLWWEWLRLVGEPDGETKYTDPEMTKGRSALDVLRAEKRRENRLLALGLILRRWGAREIREPQRLIAMLLTAGLERGEPVLW